MEELADLPSVRATLSVPDPLKIGPNVVPETTGRQESD
jgi:hypothetical protein